MVSLKLFQARTEAKALAEYTWIAGRYLYNRFEKKVFMDAKAIFRLYRRPHRQNA
jgi:hypothetical protein